VDTTTLATVALIAAIATIAPLVSEATDRKVPSVVLELAAGIIIGPQVLAWAVETPTVAALSSFGLSFLFFMAGYEIEFDEIRGRPLDLAVVGWFVSLALAASVAGVLLVTGFTVSELLIALALTTTALGTLLPMLQDADALHTRFGAFILAIGGAGEFLPIVAIALFLSGDNPLESTLLLMMFVALAAAAVAVAQRRPRHASSPCSAGLSTRARSCRSASPCCSSRCSSGWRASSASTSCSVRSSPASSCGSRTRARTRTSSNRSCRAWRSESSSRSSSS
jgi:Kef-type K+ transport system membrane component KefB